jgi:hypothetical protein
MSLDIYLVKDEEVLWENNITHNLTRLADAVDLYIVMWCADELGITTAKEALPILTRGLNSLVQMHPDFYNHLEPENGWGTYGGLVKFVVDYIQACVKYPDAIIEISK